MSKDFWRATAIRCARTFLSTIMGCWTAGTMITEVNWSVTLLAAVSTTVYIFIACVLAGIPEVQPVDELTDEEAYDFIDANSEILDELEEYDCDEEEEDE